MKFAGSAPSVTVYGPAGTFVHVSVLAVLSPVVFPLSLSVKADGVESVVQVGMVGARAVGLGMVDV